MTASTVSSQLTKRLVFGGLSLLLLAAATWAWFHFMEKRWLALPDFSPEAARNPMLASTQLLKRFQYDVKADGSLQALLRQPLPDGTLILAEAGGIFTQEQADALLAWVARGNTLITQPQWSSTKVARSAGAKATAKPANNPENKPPAAGILTDPIGEYLGVSIQFGDRDAKAKKDDDAEKDGGNTEEASTDDEDVEASAAEPEPTANLAEDDADSELDEQALPAESATNEQLEQAGSDPDADSAAGPIADNNEPVAQDAEKKPKILFDEIAFPGLAYSLQVGREHIFLNSEDENVAPLFTDASGGSVRVYEEGKGHIVLLATHYFANQQLGQRDHGELLLRLLKLHPEHKRVWIVTDLDMPVWYEALWQYYRWALVGAAVLLAVWLWRALQRFGPLLPEPSLARRSQLEHVDASGRWLWQVTGGRERLLHAARQDVEAVLQRAAPELGKLNNNVRIARIAALCDLQTDDVQLALLAPPARLPVDFTRQVQLLQKMRQHHDRHQ